MENKKRLSRSTENKAICGVCEGLSEYFGIDPIVVRLGMVMLCFAFGLGLIMYIVLAIIMPVGKRTEDPARISAESGTGTPTEIGFAGSAETVSCAFSPGISEACFETESQTADSTEPYPATDVPAAERTSSCPAAEASGAAALRSSVIPVAGTTQENVSLSGSVPCAEASASGQRQPAAEASHVYTQTGSGKIHSQPVSDSEPSLPRSQSPCGQPQSRSAVSDSGRQLSPSGRKKSRGGIVLILIGIAMLLKYLVPFLSIYLLGSIALILSGIILLSEK